MTDCYPPAPMRLLAGALGATVVTFASAAPAPAVPDGPLRPYLEHIAPLALAWPADGTVTDGFGARGGHHLGIDIGILRSPEVRAAAAGTVTATGYLAGYEGYGHVVVVDVSEGYETLYAHLAVSTVQVGDWLDRHEPIGVAGCTGSCTGTHLHLELRRRGAPIDPAPLLP